MRLWVLEEGDGEDVNHNPELADWDVEADDSDTDSDAGLPEENFNDFRGDHGHNPFADEDSSEDEEPAPDVRRNRAMRIEIVNFARPGARNPQRIALPERPRVAEPRPPVAPNPPRQRGRRGQGQQANRQRQIRNGPAHAVRPVALNDAQQGPIALNARLPNRAEDHVALNANIGANPLGQPPPEPAAMPLPLAAPGQGNHPAANMNQAGPARAMGLERFLELARNDMEDEWDSDELDDVDDADFDVEIREPWRADVRIGGGQRGRVRERGVWR